MPVSNTDREKAQVAFVEYLKRVKKSFPLLVAKFVARQVAAETAKMIPNAGLPTSELPKIDGGDYTLYDHSERLRYLEMVASEEEMGLLRQVLQTALPGLEQFVTDERHATLLGKMAYNAYGVCFGGGRDDKVCHAATMCSVFLTNFLAPTNGTSGGSGKNADALRYLAASWRWFLCCFVLCAYHTSAATRALIFPRRSCIPVYRVLVRRLAVVPPKST